MKVKNEEQNEAFRQRILMAAEDIIKEEGLDKLSIRKITQRLSYTPGIIYHYFQNKEDLLTALTMKGYQNILKILKDASKAIHPADRLSDTLRAYIEGMCAQKEVFLMLVMSEDPHITAQIDLLAPGIRHKRASMEALCQVIEAGITSGIFHCEHVELRAQVIWCATFGLIQRMCKEKVSDQQKERLIDEHIQMILQSLNIS